MNGEQLKSIVTRFISRAVVHSRAAAVVDARDDVGWIDQVAERALVRGVRRRRRIHELTEIFGQDRWLRLV
jgi:hypothetical protein